MAKDIVVRRSLLLCIVFVITACRGSGQSDSAPTAPTTAPNTPQSGGDPVDNPSNSEAPPLSRVGIRVLDGTGKFFDASGDIFVPRGVNYVDFYPTERGGYEDRVMATNVYNPDRVRTAFNHLAEYGYNTVRIFFDTCGSGPNCIGNPHGDGLNPAYLDNLVDLMHIASEEGIYLILTANSVPEEGGYWAYFDEQIYNLDQREGFESYQNADWLHPAGLEIKRRFWQDLMSGLVERDAPFESVLGWELTNELWLFKNSPPLSLDEGMVTISNEMTYDMSDPEQKRQMVIDGVLLYIEEIDKIIKGYDPEALTTIGFFAPQFPNETGIGGEWYVDTAPLVTADTPIDFWDFHAYYDTDLDIAGQAENFGMPGQEEKPVVMGETGSGQAFFPSAYSGLTRGLQWIADSCELGFDGWLNWGYYPWPDDLDGKPWTFLDEDGLLLSSMAPVNQPDACVVPDLPRANIALGRAVRFSRQLPDQPASAAVNGQETAWSAGDYPPQWIEVQLDHANTVGRVGMTTSQWPPGATRNQVWATHSDGTTTLVAEFDRFTTGGMTLAHSLPTPLDDVVSVRILSLESPSWAGWGEIEVISAPLSEREVCVGTATTNAEMRRWPDRSEPTRTVLTSGAKVLFDGFFTDGENMQWLRIGGGSWALADQFALDGECSPEALPGQPLARSVPVTFQVSVPEDTDGEIFIGGDFPGTELPIWDPYTILLQPAGAVYRATIDLPIGSAVEYAYDRGGWERVERPPSCGETNARKLIVGEGPVLVEDTVARWRDLDCE